MSLEWQQVLDDVNFEQYKLVDEHGKCLARCGQRKNMKRVLGVFVPSAALYDGLDLEHMKILLTDLAVGHRFDQALKAQSFR